MDSFISGLQQPYVQGAIISSVLQMQIQKPKGGQVTCQRSHSCCRSQGYNHSDTHMTQLLYPKAHTFRFLQGVRWLQTGQPQPASCLYWHPIYRLVAQEALLGAADFPMKGNFSGSGGSHGEGSCAALGLLASRGLSHQVFLQP